MSDYEREMAGYINSRLSEWYALEARTKRRELIATVVLVLALATLAVNVLRMAL